LSEAFLPKYLEREERNLERKAKDSVWGRAQEGEEREREDGDGRQRGKSEGRKKVNEI